MMILLHTLKSCRQSEGVYTVFDNISNNESIGHRLTGYENTFDL